MILILGLEIVNQVKMQTEIKKRLFQLCPSMSNLFGHLVVRVETGFY